MTRITVGCGALLCVLLMWPLSYLDRRGLIGVWLAYTAYSIGSAALPAWRTGETLFWLMREPLQLYAFGFFLTGWLSRQWLPELRQALHLPRAHACRGDRRRPDPEAAGDEGRTGVVGNGVAVQSDAHSVEHGGGFLARQVFVEAAQVEQHEMIVGAPGDDPQPTCRQRYHDGVFQ